MIGTQTSILQKDKKSKRTPKLIVITAILDIT